MKISAIKNRFFVNSSLCVAGLVFKSSALFPLISWPSRASACGSRNRCRSRQIVKGCEEFLPKFPQTCQKYSKENDLQKNVCTLILGGIFVKTKQNSDFAKVFTHFAQISTYFARILSDFARIFTKSKVLGVHSHRRLLHQWWFMAL